MGQDTLGCVPVPCPVVTRPTSFQVTETVRVTQQVHISRSAQTLPRKGGSKEQNTMRTGLGDLKR